MKPWALRLRPVIVAAPAGIALAAGFPALGQPPSTPLATVSSEQRRYPDGSQLVSEYETPNWPVSVPSAGASARLPVVGLAAAAAAQASLPEGFTLLTGATKQISASAPVARNAGAATTPTAQSDEKFVTLYPVAYNGIPLSKGSDYMTIVGADNQLLVTRKRGLPTTVDGQAPTVAQDAAIAAARQAGGTTLAGTAAQPTTPALEIWVDNQSVGHLAWTFTLSGGSTTDPDVRRFWVAAIGEPRVLHWESEIYHTQHGSVTGNIWTTSSAAGAPNGNRPLADLQLTRNTDNAHVITGADGLYGYTSGTGNAQITALLQGPFAKGFLAVWDG